ncbi:MAG TPA: tetratricopeptide repeat protein [Gemmatimonadaceae bacterium]|nr:tetratricopeptide repeat protein [Gemmatimonadaceae bacterium]
MNIEPDAGGAGSTKFSASILIACLALAASIGSLWNGFAFDDVHVILKNTGLHSLHSPLKLITGTYWPSELGSMLYRPSTSVVFALQWAAGDGSAISFHLVSVALYVALSIAVYRLALLVMPRRAAIVAAAVFAAHPVHVEAVANIVGQAELWVALIVVALVNWFIRIRRHGDLKLHHIAAFTLAYFVACGFKEHAIVLPAILVAAEFLVVGGNKTFEKRARELLPLMISMAIGGALFLVARYAVLHGVAVDSRAAILRHSSLTTRIFTMLSVVVEWVRLFIWPMALSADYSYPRIRLHSGFESSMIPAVLVLLGTSWIGWTIRKRFGAASFGISWMGLALLIPSNILMVTGFVLAERTLMLPTVGFALCAGVAIDWALHQAASRRRIFQTAGVAAATLVVCGFTARSVTRNGVWRDNDSLFRQTVLDVPSSHRAHWMLAAHLKATNRLPEALEEMDLAVALGDPQDPLLLAYAGDMFAMANRCPRAVPLYRRALSLAPANLRLRANTSYCLLTIGKLEEAKSVAVSASDAMSDPQIQQIVHAIDSAALIRARRM